MNSCNKPALRAHLKTLRAQIPQDRRIAANAQLKNTLLEILHSYSSVLSFCSLPEEIDTLPINQMLAAQSRLFLPKVAQDHLEIYQVTSLERQTEISAWNICEPIPERCEKATLEKIDCILIPALGFDPLKQRIGYGKGYYDRLIAERKTANLYLIGVGFEEQLYPDAFPCEPHDQPLDRILLF